MSTLSLKRRGFTLIELLVVISIIGLLSSVVLASLSAARQKGVLAGVILFTDNNYHKLGVNTLASISFNQNSGAPIDQTGNFKSLAIMNYLYYPSSPTGSGYSFDNRNVVGGGNGEMITFTTPNGSVPLPDQSGDTISVWYNTLSTPQTSTAILFLGYFNNGTVTNIIRFVGNNGPIMRCDFNAIISKYADYTLPTVDNNWHNVTCVYDGATTITLYFDGKPLATGTATAYTPTSLNGSLTPLLRPLTVGGNYKGLISNLQVFSGSLTASGVGKLYAEGLKTHQFAAK